MVKPADHGHFLRGVRFLGGGAAPSILKRREQEFIPALLREVRTEEGRAKARATLAADLDARRTLRMWQPVHRVFHVAALEVLCDQPGNPRVNPRRIDSAGMVVRRIAQERDAKGQLIRPDPSTPHSLLPVEGWMRDGDVVHGWMRLDGRRTQDPDPKRRRPALRAGNPVITARLRQPELDWARWEETVVPLFVAPPDACEAARSTILYGVVPLTSSELAEAKLEAPTADDDGVHAMVPPMLQKPGRYLLPAVLKPDTLPMDPAEQERLLARIQDIALLRGVGAFDATPEGAAIIAVLNQVSTWTAGDPDRNPRRPLGDVLKEAAAVFERDEARGIPAAAEWDTPGNAKWRDDLKNALRPLINRRVDELTSATGRYERQGALYQVQAFVRLKTCDQCPPELIWSEPSAPFTIVPWFEASDAPPVKVQLPEAKLSEMAKLKPNVAFVVPPSVQNALGGMKVKKPLEIEKGDMNLDIGWICGFSIPLITLCAFIVLSIFLSLLNIIFWWLPFIKICIPIPRVSRSPRL